MKSHLLLLAALLVLPATSHATPFAERDMRPEQYAARQSFLAEPRNRGTILRADSETGVPAFVKRGAEPLASAQHEDAFSRAQAVKQFLRENARLYRLRDPDEELVLANVRTARAQSHYRFQQHFAGVPVRGAQLLAHFDANGDMYAVNSSTLPTPETGTPTPSIREYEALAIARARFDTARIEQKPAVLEYHRIDGETRLVYFLQAYVNTVERWHTVVDAHSGEVLRHRLAVHDGDVAASSLDALGQPRAFNAWAEDGRYHMVDIELPLLTGNEDPVPNRTGYGDTYVVDLLNSEGDYQEIVSNATRNGGWDTAAVSAVTHVQAAFRYFRNVHGRAGIDGRNANLLVAIHYGENYDNAFWSGKWLVFGDGDRTFSEPAACADLIAHEYTHGVIEHTAGLLYENQPGALNESFADVFAVLVEGRNWKLAEDCTRREPGWLRNLENSSDALRWQPQHMDDYVELENTKDGDWGGVHINSGIPNHAAWLLMEGLSKRGIGESISRAKAERLYYRALTTYLTESAQFIDLRRALLLSAADLYPGDPSVADAVRAAFDAVGIVEGGSTGAASSGHLALSTSALDFGDVEIGGKKSLTLQVTNDGEVALTVHSVTADDPAFTHSFTNTVLAPGETVSGTVSFDPPTAGSAAATLRIAHDGADEAASVALLGTGTSAADDAPSDGEDKPQPSPSASGGGLFLWLFAVLPFAGLRRRNRG